DCWRELWTSTMGVSALTVIVSETTPTRKSALMLNTPPPEISTPSRLTVLKPVKVNVSEYVPGRRSTIRYCPVLSVTTVRAFSISAGLDASTVTPGSTPPDGSLTVPAIVAWARTMLGQAAAIARNVTTLKQLRIAYPPLFRALCCHVGASTSTSRPRGFNADQRTANV